MKISIIGAGNVGSTTALRLAQETMGDIVLVDILKGMACGKAFDMEDARQLTKTNYNITGTDSIAEIKDSDIVVITAGLARKPGMTREELQKKNSEILNDISLSIRKLAGRSVVIVVTNPLDIMTYFVLKTTGFAPNKVLGMGISLDSARFANLISKALNIPPAEIEAAVIGSHGEDILPLPRLSKIKGIPLDEFLDDKKIEDLILKTVNRGARIVSLLGSGSAYFAPSAAVGVIVKAITKDEKKIIGVCSYLNGEYGIKDSCIGVPCRLGRSGIEQIIELDLDEKEKEVLRSSAESIRQSAKKLFIQ